MPAFVLLVGRQTQAHQTSGIVQLVGVAEIAELLGLTRQRVLQLRSVPGFPQPVAVLSAGLIWNRRDIERWAVEQGRLFPEDD